MMKRYVFDPCRTSWNVMFSRQGSTTPQELSASLEHLWQSFQLFSKPPKSEMDLQTRHQILPNISQILSMKVNHLHSGMPMVSQTNFMGISKMSPKKPSGDVKETLGVLKNQQKFSLRISGKTKPLELGKA